MAGELLIATQFVAAAAMVALAGWLLWLNPRHLANRAFSIFLLARAGFTICTRVGFMVDSEVAQENWNHAGELLQLAALAALVAFAIAYLGRGSRAGRWGIPIVVSVWAAAEIIAITIPCALACDVGPQLWLGPLSLFNYSTALVTALVTWVLVEHALRSNSGSRRDATLTLAAGLGLNSFFDASLVVTQVTLRGTDDALSPFYPGPWRAAAYFLPVLALVPLGGTLAILTRRSEHVRWSWVIGIGATVFLSAVMVVSKNSYISSYPGAAATLVAFWRLTLPMGAGYALLRHGLFDIDLRLKRTIHRGSVAIVFLGVFFVVAQVVQNYLSQTLGFLVGGIAAGLLLFALRPIQMMSERVADTVMPRTRALEAMGKDERIEIYRSQASLAWADGILDRSERRLLDDLRERLSLSHEEAAQLEKDTVTGDTPDNLKQHS